MAEGKLGFLCKICKTFECENAFGYSKTSFNKDLSF